MKNIIASLSLAVLLSTAAQAVADDYPQPGLYKVIGKMSSGQMVSSNFESEQCIKDDQFRTDPNAWMQKHQGQTCEIVEYELSGGTITMEMTCSMFGAGASTIKGTGTYTNSGWQMRNVMQMTNAGMSMEMTTEVTGTRQGSC